MSTTKSERVHITLLGEPTVGKSALHDRLSSDKYKFNPRYNPTTYFDIVYQDRLSGDGDTTLKLQFTDMPGIDGYANNVPSSVLSKGIVILAFDVNEANSFNKLEKIKKRYERICQPPTQLVLVGTKVDSPSTNRQVTTEDAEDYAQKNDMTYFEVSAKEDINIQALQEHIHSCAEKLIQGNEIGHQGSVVLPQTAKRRQTMLNPMEQADDALAKSHERQHLLRQTDKERLKDQINAFRTKHPEIADISTIATILIKAIDEEAVGTYFDGEAPTINNCLFRLQGTHSSLCNTVANLCVTVFGTLFLGAIPIAYSLGFLESNRINKGSSLMFWSTGEKQQAEKLIADTREIITPKNR